MNKLYLAALISLFTWINTFAQQQAGSIMGRVTTSDGASASFVNVQIKDTNKGTSTDEQGNFLFKHVKPGSYVVQVTFIGFQTQERLVEVVAGQVASIDFTLAESSEQLKEVVVTDSRSLNEKQIDIGKAGIKPMDLPQSVLVIDRQVLENQQVGKISDVLVNTSGIYLMGNTGGYQEEIAGRGFSYGSSNTFKNGVRFNNGVMPETSSLERVEILKGSAAILFGNVTAGGVLNLVTKKPKFENGGEVSFRAGSYNSYKPSLDIYGSVNNSEHVAFRFNTSYENAGSFRDNVNSERIYINPSFLIKAGKKTEILIENDFLKDNRTLDFGTAAVNYEVADISRSSFLGASWAYYEAEQKSTSVTVTHKLNDSWSVNAVGAYQGFTSDLFGTTRPNASAPPATPSQLVQQDGLWRRSLQRSIVDQKYELLQVNVIGKFATGPLDHQLLFGADHDITESKTTAYKYVNPATGLPIYDSINVFDLSLYPQRTDIPGMTLNTITENPAVRVGFYAQNLITVFEKLKVLAGVRYSYMESGPNKTKTFDDLFSPRFGVVYQPLKQMSLFASYSNSFILNTGLDIDFHRLKPSTIDQFEVGIKNEIFNGLLSANVTAYQIENNNFTQSVLPAPSAPKNTKAQELAGEVISKGVEIDLMSKPFNGVSFIAGYSYNDTRYGSSSQYRDGSRLRYNPSHTANASAFYSFNTTGLKNLKIGFTTFYVGERVAGRSTRTNVTNDVYKLMPVPNYFLFDLTAGYSIQNVSLRVKASNLLNELSYNVHDDNSVNPIAPRQFSATVSYKIN